MALSPPFGMEDQTDEDFFDKLVDDDDDDDDDDHLNVVSSKRLVSEVGLKLDEVKLKSGEFGNLSVGEEGIDKEEESSGVVSSGWDGLDNVVGLDNGVVGTEELIELAAKVRDDVGKLDNGDKGRVMEADLVAEIRGEVDELDNGNKRRVDEANLAESMVVESGNSGIKLVQWSAFNTDVLQNGVADSDIFGEFGDGEKVGETLACKSNVIYGGDEHKSAYLDGTQSYGQYQEGQGIAAEAVYSADGQDVNSTEYWESLYPGWKYDQNTGQWYQVDGYDATASVAGSFDNTVHNGTPEVSYFQQTSQSGVGTVLQSSTTQSVTNWNQTFHVGEVTNTASNWNQVSQTTKSTESASNWNQVPSSINGYPSHMYLDPQYPGWYYDTIAQEWRSLDTYIPSIQAAVQSENHPYENGFTSIGTSQIDDQKTQGVYGQVGNHVAGGFSHQSQDYNSSGSFTNYNQQDSNTWQPSSAGSGFQGNQRLANQYDQKHSLTNQVSQKNPYDYGGSVPYNEKASQSLNEFSTISEHQSFFSGANFTQQYNEPQIKKTEYMNTSNSYYENQNVSNYSQQQYLSENQFSYASAAGRSSDGRPPHALISFGFGGKLIIMKDSNSPLGNSSYGGQVPAGGGSISVLNLMEVVSARPDAINTRPGVCDYFNNLCRQSIPGPLTGGNVSAKELYRWTDERIANCESPDIDYRKGEVLRLLLSLLKIALQHYGKLRSPFGTDKVLKETDSPESAVARLFASAKENGSDSSKYGAPAHFLQKLPSEAKMQTTAAEVQTLLVSGRKKEALISAQEGHMWGPALVLAAQLGDQFYVDTVKQMALHQLVPGSPLRTLCLLIAGQPAEVFAADSGANGDISNAQLGANGMLDDWEENLAVITANRTKDDELVLIHLGDCLWKERSEIVAAHICYLVAEANFEPYSDSARLCLVGADHFKYPRTYASPEAIQRTEIYEYSKLLGNSQFTLLPFQPYKLVYAHMLAEVGRVSDSLKYCQAILKSLKTGRAPEVETLRHLASSLEERIKTHQQGGFSTNLAPAKLVGKLLNLFDSTASRVVGSLPSPGTSTTAGSIQGNGHYNQASGPRVSTSQSTMAMSSLVPSDSMEPINEWTADGNRMTIHNRSASEPDFSRTPRQDQTGSSKDASSNNTQGKSSVSGGPSRLGRFGFGSQFIQKILKPRKEKQAKLGKTNKFYYDEKLKRWVEEGVDPPAEEAALPPPPTTAAFPNGISDYNLNSAFKNEGARSNGSPEQRSPTSVAHNSGIPPIPPTSNQFSARGRMGVRSRYVDTFNKGGGNQTNMFRSPSVPSVKAKSNASPKFFVPAPVSGQPLDSAADENQQTDFINLSSTSNLVQSFAPPSMNMQRFASMDDISNKRTSTPGIGNGSLPSHTRRTASWSGSIAETFNSPTDTGTKPLGEVLGMPPSLFLPASPALEHSSAKGGSYGDDLQGVEL